MQEQVFVGRQHELVELKGYLDKALVGQSHVCFVTGHAGSGKTKCQIVIETLDEELERVPIAYGPWTEGQNPAAAAIETSNFEGVEPVTRMVTDTGRTYLPLVLSFHPAALRWAGGPRTPTVERFSGEK